jgi:hypothetical protein
MKKHLHEGFSQKRPSLSVNEIRAEAHKRQKEMRDAASAWAPQSSTCDAQRAAPWATAWAKR